MRLPAGQCDEWVSFVLPLDIFSERGIQQGHQQLAYNQLRSFVLGFDFSRVLDWWVLVHPMKVAETTAWFRDLCEREALCPPVRVLDETVLVPEFDTLPMNGWQKQQLLKLAVATILDTEYYLVLDSDVLCLGPASVADLFDEHCRAYNTPWYNQVTLAGGLTDRHPRWARFSARVLQLPFDGNLSGPDPFLIGLTPVTLRRSIVLDMAAYIEQLYGFNWRIKLMEPMAFLRVYKWTEFFLYYIFATRGSSVNLWTTYHRPRQLVHPPIWERAQLELWNPRAVANETGIFFFIQGNLGLSPADIWSMTRRLLPDAPLTASASRPRTPSEYDGLAVLRARNTILDHRRQ